MFPVDEITDGDRFKFDGTYVTAVEDVRMTGTGVYGVRVSVPGVGIRLARFRAGEKVLGN